MTVIPVLNVDISNNQLIGLVGGAALGYLFLGPRFLPSQNLYLVAAGSAAAGFYAAPMVLGA